MDSKWQHLLSKALADSTQKTYASAQRKFLDFCFQFKLLNQNGSAVPASELTILRFIGSLCDSCQPSTIRVYLSAVRSLHVMHGFPDPLLDCCRVPLVLKGARRISSKSKVSKLPITPLILIAIKSNLDLNLFNDRMFWAACCTAFSVFFDLPNSQLVIKIFLLVNSWHCQIYLLMSTLFRGMFFFLFVFQKLTSLVKAVRWF